MSRLVPLLVTFACSPPPDPGGTAHALFGDRLLEVSISMDPNDAETLASQTRSFVDVIGGDCLAEPFESPFTWFEADVFIDDRYIPRTGIRKKGFIGSLSTSRPSLKLKFDKLLEDREVDGQERFTLNNNRADESRMRTCLGYSVFEDAGLPAPRCNFAHVDGNGLDLGVYTHVEAVKSRFLEEAFGDGDGDLYEGTLSDFREGWLGTFEAKTDATDPEGAPLLALAQALEVEDEALQAALEEVLDLEQFIRFWAVETLIGHWDGYAGNTNNVFVYRDPTDDRLRFIPWGPDGIFYDGLSETTPLLVAATLPVRLYNTDWGRAAYIEELRRLFDEVWDADRLQARLDTWEAQIADRVLDPAAFDESLAGLRWTVDTRHDLFEEGLALGGYDLQPELRELPCIREVGTLDVRFDTRWDSFDEDPFEAGSSSWQGEWDGQEFPISLAGAAMSGPAEEPDAATLAVFDLSQDASELQHLYIQVPTWDWQPGEVAIDILEIEGFYLHSAPPEEDPVFRAILGGTLRFDEASLTPGGPVSGRIQATLYEGL